MISLVMFFFRLSFSSCSSSHLLREASRSLMSSLSHLDLTFVISLTVCHHFPIWIWLLSSFSSLSCGRIMAFFAIILLKLLKSDYTISYSSSFALIWLHQLPPTPASNHIEETTSGIIVNLFQQVISKYQVLFWFKVWTSNIIQVIFLEPHNHDQNVSIPC